ncbi:unnamed protein product [Linum tenue]|uniref:C2 domain-containing protein n=1 Tax=Linum tenue TaxID=586396 RepID=A0AAV0LAS6_9ROSI|nr:unnamed protein product [Linum tenue]
MAAAGTRTLEFTVVSAEDLRLEGRPVKKNAFVVVRTDPFINSGSTRADSDGGSYPQWNEKVVIEMPMLTDSVTLEVRSGNRVVGAAAVPVSDFLGDGLTPEDYLHFLSYRLRDQRGVKNGIINFSVRVSGGGGGSIYGCSPAAGKKVVGAECGGSSTPPSWGVPMVGGRSNYGGGGGVVTGVPVWGSSRA